MGKGAGQRISVRERVDIDLAGRGDVGRADLKSETGGRGGGDDGNDGRTREARRKGERDEWRGKDVSKKKHKNIPSDARMREGKKKKRGG